MLRHVVVWLAIAFLSTIAACVNPSFTHCPDVDCPAGTICDGHGGCVLPVQVTLCASQADGTDCSYTNIVDEGVNGQCTGGVCLPLGCGNGIKTPDETCDDGNNTSGDGCSADCRSLEVCGNGIVDPSMGELCDDGNSVSGDGCQANCQNPRCGDGVKDAFEQCDLGTLNSEAPDSPCRTACLSRRCGDGVVDPTFGEVCDDGNTTSGDGCAPDCRSEENCGNGIVDIANHEQCDEGAANSLDPNAPCRPTCVLPRCGDDIVDTEFGEACDFGTSNANQPNAACRSNCQIARCGDKIKDDILLGEVCDDGNVVAGDGCSPDCHSDETCGNGIVDIAKQEQCDAGSNNSTMPNAPCRPTCQLPKCGDGIADTNLGEACDLGMQNSNDANATCRTNCQPRRCGDGILDTATEVCDDNNNQSGDGCSADCQSKETCGNGIIDIVKGEQCDAGTQNANTSNAPCRTTCKLPKCGDGIVDDLTLGEACDLGTNNSNSPNATCRTNCQVQRCGDHVIDNTKGEVCDDGNTADADGCRGDCKSDETCGNGILDTEVNEQCDDANTRGRDGCSACKAEDAIVLQPGATPAGRRAAAMAYDAARQRVVMYGGFNGAYLTDTWEWDGVSWTQLFPKTNPGGRQQHAMTYDAKRHRIVLFGGSSNAGALNDTWEWDGVNWTQMTATTSPNTRYFPAMAYDGNRKKVVLYGGFDTVLNAASSETWEWTGTTWNKLTTGGTSPGPRYGGSMTFDSAASRKYLVMYGGSPDGKTFTFDGANWTQASTTAVDVAPHMPLAYDANRGATVMWHASATTWEWSGSAWTAMTDTSPATREEAAMAYDAKRKQLVMFGGVTGAGTQQNPYVYYSETWLRTGTVWALAPAWVEPGPRMRSAAAYDPLRGVTVIFGGQQTTCLFCGNKVNDTWEFDGRKWTQTAPSMPVELVARSGQFMDYHRTAKKIVMWGGSADGYTNYNDLYMYDGMNWTAPTSSTGGPLQKTGAMVYDAANDKVVEFAGNPDWNSNNQTWTWSASTGWVDATPSMGMTPQGRHDHAFAYDLVRKKAVMFGGVNANWATIGDTWEWDTAAGMWTNMPANGPGSRKGHMLVFDPDVGRVLVYGRSGNGFEDLWEWTGATWINRSLVNAPAERYRPATAYDALRHAIVVFGGRDTNYSLLGSTQLLRYRPNGTPEACTDASVDYDNDNKAGCADDECWSVCDPLHPPGTTRPSGAPYCGDGTCNGVEDCSACPADCGACAGQCGDYHCDSGESATTCPNDC